MTNIARLMHDGYPAAGLPPTPEAVKDERIQAILATDAQAPRFDGAPPKRRRPWWLLVLVLLIAAALITVSVVTGERHTSIPVLSPEPSTPATPSSTTAPTGPATPQEPTQMPPSPTRNYHTDIVEYPEGFTPSIEFVDCTPPPNDFIDWMLDPAGDKGRPRRDDAVMAIGAVVTSPSGQWAVFAEDSRNDGAGPPISKRAYLAPYPLAPETEVIHVARIRADTGEKIWGFDNYTSWRGDLQDLGHQGVEAAFNCI